MTDNNTASVQPEPPRGSLRRFEDLIRNDLGSAAIHDRVRALRATPAAPVHRLPLRLGTVAGHHLHLCLDQTCHAVPLSPAASDYDLTGLDMILLEATWETGAPDWARQLRDPGVAADPAAPLTRLLAAARRQGVQSVLWFTTDITSLDTFAHLHGLADASVAADPDVAAVLGKGGAAVPVVPLAVAPGLHNPMVHDPEGQQYIRRNFGLVSDSYNEICGLGGDSTAAEILEPALDHLFWMFETRFLMRNNNARLDKDFRRRFVGCLEDIDRATLLNNASYYLPAVTNPGRGQPDKTRNILEAMASKALVLTNLEAILPEIAPYLRRVASAGETRAALAELTGNQHLHRMMTHLAYREVMRNHTYGDRLRAIAGHLGLPAGKTARPADPLITAMVPTMRPQLLPFVLDGYRRQSYPDLELVIVLHSDSYSAGDIAPMLREEDRARVIRVPESQSVGMALNVGVDAARGEYWARIDDDDYYGPNYFSDAMLTRSYYDFDICGKSQWFIYFEAARAAYVHKRNWAAHSTNPAIAGGTFLVRNARNGRLRFNDRVRGYADVDLIGREIDRGGCRLVSTDPFNFLQIRRMDRRSHTWTADMSQIVHREKITDGMNLSRIGI